MNITLTSKKFGFSRIACQLLLLALDVHQSNFKTLTQLLAEERNCDSPMGFSARNFHSSFSVKYKLVSRNRKWRKRSSPAYAASWTTPLNDTSQNGWGKCTATDNHFYEIARVHLVRKCGLIQRVKDCRIQKGTRRLLCKKKQSVSLKVWKHV